MDDDVRAAAHTFARYLVALRDAVGRPSLYRLEKVSGARHRQGQSREPIKRSTLYDHLRGERLKIPQWRMVHELLQVCRQIAEDDRYVDPEFLGTDEEWRNAWREAQRGNFVTKAPGQLQPVEIPAPRNASTPAAAPVSSPQGRTPLQQQPLRENNPAAAVQGDPAAQNPDDQRHRPATRTTVRPDPPTAAGKADSNILYAPEMGEEGGWVTVIEWLHGVGERVNRDDKLVRVRTHTMIDLELPARSNGVLRKIFAAEKAEVAAGDPLCEIG